MYEDLRVRYEQLSLGVVIEGGRPVTFAEMKTGREVLNLCAESTLWTTGRKVRLVLSL